MYIYAYHIYIYVCIYIYMYIYMYLYIYISLSLLYIYAKVCVYIYICSPPTSAYLFSYYIDCLIARSTICYLLSAKKNKKQCIGEPSPLPHPKVGLPKLCFFVFVFFFSWYSSPSKAQPKTSHPKCVYVYSFWCGGELVCLFFLVCIAIWVV